MLFEVNFWRLAITLSWWISCFITTKGIKLFSLSYQTLWEEVRTTDDVGINLVSNYSTVFKNYSLVERGDLQ